MKKSSLIYFCLLFFTTCLFSQWQTEIRLTNAPGPSSHPEITSSGNFIHLIWTDHRVLPSQVFYKRSVDQGITWSTDFQLTNVPYGGTSFMSLSSTASNVYAAWFDYRDTTNTEIYFKRSTDNGVTWAPELRITNNPHISKDPKLASSGSIVHLIWIDRGVSPFEMFYRRSTDGGQTFGTASQPTLLPVMEISMACSGSNVHLCWVLDSNNLSYKRSTDGGVTWGSDIQLTNNPAIASAPSITASGNDIHIVWQDYRDARHEIYYKRSTNNGLTWSADTKLTSELFGSRNPKIYSSGNMVHVVYFSGEPNSEIFYKRSANSGVAWENSVQVSASLTAALWPAITASGTRVHVVWADSRHGSSNPEIYYNFNPTGNIGIVKIRSEIPKEFALSQNYPNPFNPVTNIKFALPSSSFAKLVVFDVLGREVANLVNEQLKPGIYEVDFDGTNFPSGVYFYKLTSENFIQTKKMMLIK
jgi:hypothetical protein